MNQFFKQTLLVLSCLISFCANAQILVSPITINLPANPPANTAEWANTLPPVMVLAQTKLVNGQINGFVQDSKILVTIKSAGSKVCGTYTPQNAPISGFNSVSKNWTGANLLSLLGQECILKPGSYELCVQFYSYGGATQSRILGESCKPFTIVDKKDKPTYSPPTNVSPVNEKAFTEKELIAPVTFRWTPIIPRPKDPVVYKLRVWQLMQGQSATQAMKTTTPILEEEVTNITQMVKKITFPPNAIAQKLFIWNVEASKKNAMGEVEMLGVSEPSAFRISANTVPPTPAVACLCGSWLPSINYELSPNWNGPPTSTGSVLNNGTITMPTNLFLKFNNIVAPSCVGSPCNSTITYSMYDNNNAIIFTNSSAFNAGLSWESPCLNTGKYKAVISANCGSTRCNDFVIFIDKPCPPTCNLTINSNPVVCSSNNTNTNGVDITGVTGGTAPYTYLWNTVPAQTTQNLTNVMPGKYWVKVTDANGCTKTDTFRIICPPLCNFLNGISQFNQICSGGSVTIGAAAVTGLNYAWSSNPIGFTSNLSTVSVSPTTSTTYTLSITNANTNCPPKTSTAVVTVNNCSLPTATCEGDGYNISYNYSLPTANPLSSYKIALELYKAGVLINCPVSAGLIKTPTLAMGGYNGNAFWYISPGTCAQLVGGCLDYRIVITKQDVAAPVVIQTVGAFGTSGTIAGVDNDLCCGSTCPCPTVKQQKYDMGGHCAVIDTVTNTCNKQIVSWTLKINGVLYTNETPYPQIINANATIVDTIMLINAGSGVKTFTYTFTYADGTTCNVDKQFDFTNCTIPPPTCPTCTVSATFKLSNGPIITLPNNLNGTSVNLVCDNIYSIIPAVSCTVATENTNILFDAPFSYVTDNYNVNYAWPVGSTATTLKIPANWPAGRLYSIHLRWKHATIPNCNYFANYNFGLECLPCGATCTPTVPVSSNGVSTHTLVANTNYSGNFNCNTIYNFAPNLNCTSSSIPILPIQIKIFDVNNNQISPTWLSAFITNKGIGSLVIPAAINGMYKVKYYYGKNNIVCDSFQCVLNIACQSCICNAWNDVAIATTNATGGTVNIPMKCGDTAKIDVSKPFTINPGGSCSSGCTISYVYDVFKPDGTMLHTNAPQSVFVSMEWNNCNGYYKVIIKPVCGTLNCPPCTIYIKRECPPVCACPRWGSFAVITQLGPAFVSNNLQCGDTLVLNSTTGFSINTPYICSAGCASVVLYDVLKPDGSILYSSVPQESFIMSEFNNCAGYYKITIKRSCGTQNCTPCIIYFKRECPPACSCGTWGNVIASENNGALLYMKPCGSITPMYLEKNRLYKFNYNLNCAPSNTACNPSITYQIYFENQLIPNLVPASSMQFTYSFQNCGNYKIVAKGMCGAVACLDSCVTYVTVNCPCACIGNDSVSYSINGNAQKVKCLDTIKVLTTDILNYISKKFSCSNPNVCASNGYTDMYSKNGQFLGRIDSTNLDYGATGATFTGLCDSIFKLVFKNTCGTTACDSCIVFFKVTCPPPPCNCGIWGKVRVRRTGSTSFSQHLPSATITRFQNERLDISIPFSCNPASSACTPTNRKYTITYFDINNNPQVLATGNGHFIYNYRLQNCGRYRIDFETQCGTNICKAFFNIIVDCCGGRKITLKDNTGKDITSNTNCINAGQYTFNLSQSVATNVPINYTITYSDNTTYSGVYNYNVNGFPINIPPYSCNKKSFTMVFKWNGEWCSDTIRRNICDPGCCNFVQDLSTIPFFKFPLELVGAPNAQSVNFRNTFFIPNEYGTITFNKIKVQIVKIFLSSVNGSSPFTLLSNANIGKIKAEESTPIAFGTGTVVNTAVTNLGDAIWFTTPITINALNVFQFYGNIINIGLVPPNKKVNLRLRYTFYKNNGTCDEEICAKEINY